MYALDQFIHYFVDAYRYYQKSIGVIRFCFAFQSGLRAECTLNVSEQAVTLLATGKLTSFGFL